MGLYMQEDMKNSVICMAFADTGNSELNLKLWLDRVPSFTDRVPDFEVLRCRRFSLVPNIH